MMNYNQLKTLIVQPAIADLRLYSDDAVELLMFTCANESLGGTFLKQIDGPALGIFQMEPKTYNDIWQNYIAYNSGVHLQLLHNFGAATMPDEERLIYDLRFAAAMARLHYARVKPPLPKQDDPHSIWNYYKTYYNTDAGKANESSALMSYQLFKNG
jgi:hypothetical protein